MRSCYRWRGWSCSRRGGWSSSSRSSPPNPHRGHQLVAFWRLIWHVNGLYLLAAMIGSSISCSNDFCVCQVISGAHISLSQKTNHPSGTKRLIAFQYAGLSSEYRTCATFIRKYRKMQKQVPMDKRETSSLNPTSYQDTPWYTSESQKFYALQSTLY